MSGENSIQVKYADRETEAVLVIGSKHPECTVKQIAELASIANYRLLPKPPQTIHDLYYDQPVGFRLRDCNGVLWLCLKGPAGRTEWGGIERQEIEVRWSKTGLTRIIKELENRGVKLGPVRNFEYDRPRQVLKKLGVRVIQDRETERKPRDIVITRDKKGLVRAELAIDSVVYHFSQQDIRIYEIEIESKSSIGPRVVRTVRDALVAQSGSVLRPWLYGKLATGLAIERLLATGARKELVDARGTLLQAAWSKIKIHISQGS